MFSKYLPTFITAADCGSFSKASEQLFISPNAVMKQINQFEQELDMKLFERTHHGIRLTEEGELLYEKALYIMAYSEASLRQIREHSRQKQEEIRIGVSVLRHFNPLLNEIRHIRSRHQNWNMNVVSFDDEKNIYAKMIPDLGNKIDCLFGLYSESRLTGKAGVLHLNDYPICIAASVNHPLADRQKLTFSDLKGYSLIIVEKGDTPAIDAVRQEIETTFPEITLFSVPAYDISTFNLCASVNGIMISSDLWDGIHPLLVNVPLISDHTVTYGCIYARNPSSQIREFIREVAAEYAK